jgi:hypothetical protein
LRLDFGLAIISLSEITYSERLRCNRPDLQMMRIQYQSEAKIKIRLMDGMMDKTAETLGNPHKH